VPNLDARGPAQINAAFEGTLDRPRILDACTSKMPPRARRIFQPGLAPSRATWFFDATRLFLENMSAESGGGTLHLSGSVNYAESPLRYDLSVRTDRVRIGIRRA